MITKVMPRMAGKTTQVVKAAAKDFLYIVCLHHENATLIAGYAQELGLDIPFPITFDEFLQGKFHGKGINGFIIDNVDMLLEQMAGRVPIKMVTITKSCEHCGGQTKGAPGDVAECIYCGKKDH